MVRHEEWGQPRDAHKQKLVRGNALAPHPFQSEDATWPVTPYPPSPLRYRFRHVLRPQEMGQAALALPMQLPGS